MSYRNCQECGAKCCRIFCIPLVEYISDLDGNPEKYFNLRENIKVIDTRFGKEIVFYSRCRALREDNTCNIYGNHPDLCKNFTEKTAHRYCVPRGCIYDPDDIYGEDFGI